MKFDLEKFKDGKFSLIRKSMEGAIQKLPSEEKRYIKDKQKVDDALKEMYEKHNHSWYDEVLLRNQNNMEKEALFYRDNVISYQEMFREADKLVSALSNYGLQKGDEVLMCVSNTPEMVYLLLACSKLGLKPNIFGADFSKDYIKDIIKESSDKIIFISDDNYIKIHDIIGECAVKKKVIYSLLDSANYQYRLGNYLTSLKKEYHFEEDCDYQTISGFINEYYDGKAVIPRITLDDDFTVTYTSGSTKNGRPKAIIHRVRSFMAIGRFHDADLSGNPKMKNLRSLAHIPPHSNTCLITSISDMLFQNCSVALEPIYSDELFLQSIISNEPNLVPATKSFWVKAMKDYLEKDCYYDLKLPYLMVAIAVGEPVSRNEEKFINQVFRELNMGTKMVPFPLSPVTLSIGGGDCEHGGLFFILFKNLRERLSFTKEEYGLKPFALANFKVLREDLTECNYNELGILVGDSPCTMKEYKNNQEATDNFFMEDAMGERYSKFNVWGYFDKKGNIHFKGRCGNEFRLKNGKLVPMFMIADVILKDTENIMSCEVVNVENKLYAHIEFYPNGDLLSMEENDVLGEAMNRLKEVFPEELWKQIRFIIRDNQLSYPLTGCGKRNIARLEEESRQLENILEGKSLKLIKKL